MSGKPMLMDIMIITFVGILVRLQSRHHNRTLVFCSVSRMAPKIKGTQLSGVDPTPEELKQAMATLNNLDKSGRRSKLGCLGNFMKQNPDPATDSLDMNTRLVKFFVHSMRDKARAKTISTDRTVLSSKLKEKTYHEWSAETMDKKLGPLRAKESQENKQLFIYVVRFFCVENLVLHFMNKI